MKKPEQIALFEPNADRPKRQVEYVPPHPRAVREFAYDVCVELKDKDPAAADSEIVSDLAAFLNFIARTSARYLNKGHKQYLLEGYLKSEPTGTGVSNDKKKTITKRSA
jgi:hypothetical protein